jgi:hypothetical protein
VLEAIHNQIELLKQAVSTHLLMPSIIDGDFEDITEYEAITIREKCHILSLALSVATDNLPRWKNWNMCCEVVIGLAKRMGLCSTRNARVVRNWYQKFRVKRKFQVSASKKHDLPPFLERNKELCISIKTYVRENLAELSSEMLCQYLHNTLLPVMIKEETGIEKGSNSYTEALKETLYKHGLPKFARQRATTGSASWDLRTVPRRKATLWTGMKSQPQ